MSIKETVTININSPKDDIIKRTEAAIDNYDRLFAEIRELQMDLHDQEYHLKKALVDTKYAECLKIDWKVLRQVYRK